jgi:aerotolerance regulator-like protein
MTFDRPAALLGFLLLPIVWWLASLAPSRLPWPSLLAWPGATADARGKRRGRPRWWLLIAASVLLVTALARPALEAGSTSRDLLLIVDRSASMRAPGPDGSPRLRTVARRLGARLAALPSDTLVRLLWTPSLLQEDAGFLSPSEAASRIASASPIDAADDLEAVVGAALALRRERTSALWIASDRFPAPAGETSGGAIADAWLVVSGPLDNDGITFAEVVERGESLHVDATVRRAAGRAEPRAVEWRLDGTLVRTTALGADAESVVSIEVPAAPSAETIEVRLSGSDALAADDRFVIVRARAGRARVAATGSPSESIRRAAAASGADVGADPPVDLWVCNGVSPPPRARAWLGFRASGAPLAIGEDVDVVGLRVDPAARVFLGLDVARLAPTRAAAVVGGTPEVWASTPSGPVSVAASSETGVQLGFGPEDGGFSDDPAFPLLVERTIERAAGNGRAAGWRWHASGDDVTWSARDATTAHLRAPSGSIDVLSPATSGFRHRPREIGVHRIVCGGDEWPLAVDLASKQETLAEGGADESPETSWTPDASRAGARRSTDLRPVLAAAALILVLASWISSARIVGNLLRRP